ncbi:MAG: peptidoglycan-binding protein [Ilumatobacter sp.]
MKRIDRVAPVRGLRRKLLVRGACATALAALAWGAGGQVASAAPGSALQAPLVASAFTGLQVGSQGNDVQALQQALINAGIPVRGGADGDFGPVTRQAVINFQNARGLPATGVVDESTSSALATNSGGSGSDSGAVDSSGMARGAQGDAVKQVQEQLIASGVFVPGGADGVYGAATERAVTQFQRWNGLDETGTVNAATAAKLGVAGSSGNESTDTPPAVTPEPPVTSDANEYVGLARGARGPLVVELQQALQSTGLVVRGGADGVFGGATESSLQAFQRVNSLSQTGVVSARGAELLKLGVDDAPTPPPASSDYLGLKNGSRGTAVQTVQQALITAGVSVRGGADGVFGNATATALTSYQNAVGVTADGTVNQATIDKLGLDSGSAPEPFESAPPADSTPPAADTPESTNPYVGLSAGSAGELVKELQQALQDTGLTVRGGADGVFGNATKSALIAFQSVNDIAETGVVTERGAQILGLGTGSVGISTPSPNGNDTPADNGNSSFTLERFPVQGNCFFGDTWHAPRSGGRKHEGVDIIAAQGNLLYAVADGEISLQYWDQPGALAGNGLRLLQPNGTYFTYLHLASFAPGIKVGTQVKAGDVIGFVGSTGSSATPHLHFEIHPGGGAAINPYPHVKAIDDCANTSPQYQSSFA